MAFVPSSPGDHERGDADRGDPRERARQVVHAVDEAHRLGVEQEDVAERERQLPAEGEPGELDVARTAAGDEREGGGAGGPARCDGRTVGDHAERDVGQDGAGAERDERDLVPDALRAHRARRPPMRCAAARAATHHSAKRAVPPCAAVVAGTRRNEGAREDQQVDDAGSSSAFARSS